MTIGDRIKEIRKNNGLTQVELGNLTGINADIIRKYEKGVRIPKYDRLEVIANALGTSVFTLQGTSVSEDEELVQLLMRLDEAALIDISRTEKEITITLDNKIHHSSNLTTYLNAWLNAKEELNESDSLTDTIDYETWKNEFPLNINEKQQQIANFHEKYYDKLKDKIRETRKKIARRSELVLTLKKMLENGITFDCIKNADITDGKMPKVVTIPTLAFPICEVDGLVNLMESDKVNNLANGKKKLDNLFTEFLLELDDIKALGISVESFIAIKGNIEYLCYTIHMANLEELPEDIALIKNQMPHDELISYYNKDLIEDDTPELFEKNFTERLDDTDFFFRDKI